MKQVAGFLAGLILLLVVAVVLLPFAVVWCLVLVAGNLLIPPPRAGGRESARAGRRNDAASIMILNWNGRELLESALPSVRAAVARDGGDHEIIVIDNGSTDDSVGYIEREFPEVKLVRHPRNLKFVRGYNDAFAEATKDILVLLNNDMVVDEDFLAPLLRGFDDPDAFAVSSQIFLADPDARRVETGLTGGAVRQGALKLWHDDVPEHLAGLIPCLWAGGGSSAFDKRRLLEIGGFDPLYDPFYFEDAGLGYEAWKRGWNVLFAPESRVVHEHQATSRRLRPSSVAIVRRRNQHLFGWRHLTAASHTITTTLLLPLNVPRLALANHGSSLLHRAWIETCGIAATLPRLPRVLFGRIRHAKRAERSDAGVFALAHSRHRYERGRSRRSAAPKDSPLDILMLTARVPKRGVDGSWGVFELIRNLGGRHRVTLFTLMDSQDDQDHVDALRPFVQRLEAWPIEREVGVADLHHRIPKHLRQYYTSIELRRRLAVLLRTEHFDVMQVDYIEMASMVDDAARGVRCVHVVHEPKFRAEKLLQIGGIFPRLLRFARYAQAVNFESRLYPKFEVLSCLSSKDAVDIKRWVPDQHVVVNPYGVDIDRIEPCPPSSGHTLLSVAYFGHGPNVDATVWFVKQVLPLVQAEIPDVELRLVGRGATGSIVALKENPGVELLGSVPDLVPEMERCALNLAPVREGGGLRTKVLESLAYGRTMVMTPIAAAGILVEDGRECRIAADARGYADAIIELLRDDDRRHAMEKAARELVIERYTAEIMAQRSETLYRELIEHDDPGASA